MVSKTDNHHRKTDYHFSRPTDNYFRIHRRRNNRPILPSVAILLAAHSPLHSKQSPPSLLLASPARFKPPRPPPSVFPTGLTSCGCVPLQPTPPLLASVPTEWRSPLTSAPAIPNPPIPAPPSVSTDKLYP
ncbi:hypothetical protein GUJ93_ZPchr0006g44435 [Zizania palustris]|uniref:Uncharacterized protein n=1 Tax=Zizania palustris TaxID=103762 RepID=A0A8J5TCL1_ZIZPA|nr:hypothetical protein GUJ93_ZPchr0006g44435 [Zizania palustris]